jgi:hypothetical protein
MYLSVALVDLGRFFSLIYTQSVGLLGQGISPLQVRYLHRITQTQNKRTQSSMPRVGFEPTIPVSERAKTVDTLDRAATVIGSMEQLDDWKLAWETEVFGENLSQNHFVHHKSHMTWRRIEPGKPATNHLNYGMTSDTNIYNDAVNICHVWTKSPTSGGLRLLSHCMDAISSSETSAATPLHIPEDSTFHNLTQCFSTMDWFSFSSKV